MNIRTSQTEVNNSIPYHTTTTLYNSGGRKIITVKSS